MLCQQVSLIHKISTIYTIGHSTHSADELIGMLSSFNVEMLVDIRRFASSAKFPQFNQDNLMASLGEKGIGYIHLEELGGRRKAKKESRNVRWRNASFRGYADYMEIPEFERGISTLAEMASKRLTAYMCSEAVWWRCHRAMVSDYLKAKGWRVLHILSTGKAEEHPYTSPARIVGDQVFYFDEPGS